MTVLLTSEPLVELLESPRIIDARYGVFFRLHPASIPSMLTGVKGIAIMPHYSPDRCIVSNTPAPIRAAATGGVEKGARIAAEDDVDPVADPGASVAYRRQFARGLSRDALRHALPPARGS